jgi:subtilisin family serine protease
MRTIILRSNKQPQADSVPVSTLSHDPGEVKIEVADLSPKELAGVRRNRQVIGTAPAMPMHLVRPLGPPSEPKSHAPEVTWGVLAVRAAGSSYTGEGITVAVLDTGIDREHPAFKGRGVEIQTENFTDEPDSDMEGHGTHCAGTIFGRETRGCRIGVAHGITKALIGKVLGKGGSSTDVIFRAILWAYQKGAQVISISLGMDFPGFQESLAQRLPAPLATSMALAGYLENVRLFDRLSQVISGRNGLMQGAVVVAAAGNESQRQINPDYRITIAPPAAAELFLSVAAIGPGGVGDQAPYIVAPFSNIGARVSAPGMEVFSAWPGGGLLSLDGTSMAAPHAAGVAALWAEKLMRQGRPFRAADVIDSIVKSALDLPGLDPDDVGLGLVQAP